MLPPNLSLRRLLSPKYDGHKVNYAVRIDSSIEFIAELSYLFPLLETLPQNPSYWDDLDPIPYSDVLTRLKYFQSILGAEGTALNPEVISPSRLYCDFVQRINDQGDLVAWFQGMDNFHVGLSTSQDIPEEEKPPPLFWSQMYLADWLARIGESILLQKFIDVDFNLSIDLELLQNISILVSKFDNNDAMRWLGHIKKEASIEQRI